MLKYSQDFELPEKHPWWPARLCAAGRTNIHTEMKLS